MIERVGLSPALDVGFDRMVYLGLEFVSIPLLAGSRHHCSFIHLYLCFRCDTVLIACYLSLVAALQFLLLHKVLAPRISPEYPNSVRTSC